MPVDHLLISVLLLAVVILLVTEWIPLEATALLTLGVLAVTGLVPAATTLATTFWSVSP